LKEYFIEKVHPTFSNYSEKSVYVMVEDDFGMSGSGYAVSCIYNSPTFGNRHLILLHE
jgi:hypothetical protein